VWIYVQIILLFFSVYLIIRKIAITIVDSVCEEQDAKLVLARGSIPKRMV
jgi:hypothetical protein